MTHQSERRERKGREKISWREFFITLGLVGASGMILALDSSSKNQPEPTEQEPHVSIDEIRALMRDFESPNAPYRTE